MAKFIKLKLNGLPKSETTDIHWRMVIDNMGDLKEYHSLNATLNMEAFMTLERDDNDNIALSHLGPASTRQTVLHRYLRAKIDCTPKGEQVYPLIEVAQLTDKKYLAMLKFLMTKGAIQINEAGGYCGLQDFIKTWDGEILEEIEKDSFGFPVSDAAIEADTLILENAHVEYCGNYLESRVKENIENVGSIKTIYNLREIDATYLMQCISVCKNVVIQTQLQDDSQLSSFMKMFKRIPHKNIYLYVSEKIEQRIKSHEDFAANSTVHNIIFIN